MNGWSVSYGFAEPFLEFKSRAPLPRYIPEPTIDGGSDIAASGIAEAFEIRTDNLAPVRLPFFEDEFPAVRDWFLFAQRHPGTPFHFRFNSEEAASQYLVVLHEPMLGKGGFKPEQDRYQHLWYLPVTLRTMDGSYFGYLFTSSWTSEF